VLNRGSQSETNNTHERDPLADQDILESIEPEYFNSEGFDPCNHELQVNTRNVLYMLKDINGNRSHTLFIIPPFVS
jgi:hypothetical protein